MNANGRGDGLHVQENLVDILSDGHRADVDANIINSVQHGVSDDSDVIHYLRHLTNPGFEGYQQHKGPEKKTQAALKSVADLENFDAQDAVQHEDRIETPLEIQDSVVGR